MSELVLLNSAWGGSHSCPGSWFDSLQHISITPSWIVTGPLFGDLVGRRRMVEGGCGAHSSLSGCCSGAGAGEMAARYCWLCTSSWWRGLSALSVSLSDTGLLSTAGEHMAVIIITRGGL